MLTTNAFDFMEFKKGLLYLKILIDMPKANRQNILSKLHSYFVFVFNVVVGRSSNDVAVSFRSPRYSIPVFLVNVQYKAITLKKIV